jgi:hypothetical protein
MNALARYLDLIVEPTVEQFERNERSIRHAYLACVATYHAVDRASYPERPYEVAEDWRQRSDAFALVEIVALDFKHVKSTKNKAPPGAIPVGGALYGDMDFNYHMLNDTGELAALHNLVFVVRDAVTFLRQQAEATR